ncbi:C4-dicarboxylate ABC transporter permease [Vreelandella aquamarina]|jgi:TRAP-type C4-dicarboxylate transport system permease small subunit|uniref:TRAP transporter small permease protein n=1 Tax=Vreelandella aquamarina TaxID=77097 RepID=A0A6F8XDV4_9GAMM|nr:TRAP transporter small permease [Halomonas meridiana]BCB71553.1 C4-dicarboxylate ABC transporter permease [Halomonas meridiana]
MAIPDTQIPDTSAFLDDPQRQPLEIDTEQRRGPAIFRWLTQAMEHVIAALLVALIVSVSANVVGRALFNNSLPWADELARMLFVWLIFIGAAAAFTRYEHIAVDILVRRLPPRAAHTLYLFQHVIITVLMGVIIWGGFIVMSRASSRTAILNVPWNFINVSFVLCATFIAAVSIWRAWQSIQQIRSPDITPHINGGL